MIFGREYGKYSKNRYAKNKLCVIICVFLIIILYVLFFYNDQNIKKFSLSNPEEYELEQNIFLIINGSSYINRIEINVTIIDNNSPYQFVENININPKPVSIETDNFENKIARFQFDDIKANQTIEINIKYLLRIYSLSFDIDYSDELMYRGSSEEKYKLHILPEKYIESDSNEIKTTLNRVVENTSGWLALKKIYDFVKNHITYTKDSIMCKGALCALINKRGDCTEFTDLFIALCRAKGVPARFVTGFVTVPFSDKVVAHNWAEVYVEDYGWVPIDPTNKLFGVKPNNYIVVSYGRSIEALKGKFFYFFKISIYNKTDDLQIIHSQEVKIKKLVVKNFMT